MNIQEIKKALPVLLKNNICPFIWGSQGIGKTQTIGQYCKDSGLQLVHLYTATQEVGDLIGLLVKDEDTNTVYHARPSWFPTEGQGIIFLDELNRAPNDVLQALFSFILNGTLHTHKLPPGWKVVAAGNYQSDKFTVTDTSDAAWMSRFCHIDFQPSTEEWIVYTENLGYPDVAAFIREQPSLLQDTTNAKLDMSFIVPDRRSWLTGVAPIDREETIDDTIKYELFCGLIGTAAAAAYAAWKKKQEKTLALNQILTKYDGKVKRKVTEITSSADSVRFDLLNPPLEELLVQLGNNADYLKKGSYLENFKKYLVDIPKELSTKALLKLAKLPSFYGKDELVNNPEFVKLFS